MRILGSSIPVLDTDIFKMIQYLNYSSQVERQTKVCCTPALPNWIIVETWSTMLRPWLKHGQGTWSTMFQTSTLKGHHCQNMVETRSSDHVLTMVETCSPDHVLTMVDHGQNMVETRSSDHVLTMVETCSPDHVLTMVDHGQN